MSPVDGNILSETFTLSVCDFVAADGSNFSLLLFEVTKLFTRS